MPEGNLVAYLKRPKCLSRVGAVEDRLAELGLTVPEVVPPRRRLRARRA